MKTFNDLDFKDHSIHRDGLAKEAVMTFEDGSNISVLKGSRSLHGFYCSGDTFEIMSSRMSGDGVKGWVTEKQITTHMRYIQKHPKK